MTKFIYVPGINVCNMANGVGRTSATEFDAVHPRFAQPLTEEETRECKVQMYYYCGFCNLYFPATAEGLKYHFKMSRIRHVPVGPCFYCDGPVFVYMFRNEEHYYHNCSKRLFNRELWRCVCIYLVKFGYVQ